MTTENHREVLARARYRKKREIERLVAELAPARAVPALIEPLAAGARAPLHGGWAAFAESSAGWVRQLEPGDGPTRAPSAPDGWHAELLGELGAEEVAAPERQEVDAESSAPERQEVGPQGERPTGSVRYRIQFPADQAYVDLLEQARALLWHRLPTGDLAQLQRLALEALVEKLVSRKYGAGARAEVSVTETASVIGSEAADGPRHVAETSDATMTRRRGAKPRHRMIAPGRTTNTLRCRVLATRATSPRPCAAPSGSGTRHAARSSMRGACAAAPRRRSSCITNGPSPEAGAPPLRTFACAVEPTTSSPPSRTSAESSCSPGNTGRRGPTCQRDEALSDRAAARCYSHFGSGQPRVSEVFAFPRAAGVVHPQGVLTALWHGLWVDLTADATGTIRHHLAALFRNVCLDFYAASRGAHPILLYATAREVRSHQLFRQRIRNK